MSKVFYLEWKSTEISGNLFEIYVINNSEIFICVVNKYLKIPEKLSHECVKTVHYY